STTGRSARPRAGIRDRVRAGGFSRERSYENVDGSCGQKTVNGHGETGRRNHQANRGTCNCLCAGDDRWKARCQNPPLFPVSNPASASRDGAWKWWICGLLLLATTINYMDRQTLANAAVRIINEFKLSKEKYGDLELAFGWAFAAGSLLFGFIADRVSV